MTYRRRRVTGAGACAVALGVLAWTGAAAAGGTPPASGFAQAPSSARGRPSTERGIVQSVSSNRLVLKGLDGGTVVVAIDARTRVVLDGRAASILDIRPGFVAVVTVRGGGGAAALKVDAFSTAQPLPPLETVSGVVRSVSAGQLILTGSEGQTIAVPVDAAAQVLVDDAPASLLDVRPGFVAVVLPAAGKLGATKARPQAVFAFGPRTGLYYGVVAVVAARTVVLRLAEGGTVTIGIAPSARVFVNGIRSSIRRVRPGLLAVVRTGPRPTLWVFTAR